ncbi:MAG: PASTA domain-containing protein [Acidobacteria bacterium]|nr:PASTA domain-containing protein [Acidobacteriota bacterium]
MEARRGFTGRVWGAGKLLVLLVLLGVTYAVSFGMAMRVALRTRDVRVPDLRGRSVNQASTSLTELGLPLKVEDARRSDPKVPAGLILAQEPVTGSTARRPRSVKVWLSAGPAVSRVPAVVGLTERTAQLRLESEGVGIRELAAVRSSTFPAGVVVAQNPAAGAASDTVAILVNRGERGATYVMPDLIGVNALRAAEVLRTRGFRVALVAEQPYPGVPPGIVLRQSPLGGFQIAPGDAISLEVSR